MLNGLITFAGLALLLGACLFAAIKGGPAERGGSLVYAAAWLVTVAVEMFTGIDHPIVLLLSLDAVVASGFLFLAIRYNSLWLGAALILQGVQLGVHADHLNGQLGAVLVYGFALFPLLMNLLSLGILLTISFGAAMTMRERIRRRAQKRREEAAEAGLDTGEAAPA